MCNLALYIVSQIRVHRFFDTTGVDLVLHFVFFFGGGPGYAQWQASDTIDNVKAGCQSRTPAGDDHLGKRHTHTKPWTQAKIQDKEGIPPDQTLGQQHQSLAAVQPREAWSALQPRQRLIFAGKQLEDANLI